MSKGAKLMLPDEKDNFFIIRFIERKNPTILHKPTTEAQ